MSKPLTYLSLKCVLEYLEANKRIHLATRCLALRKMEGKIPLHLDQLSLGHSEITLNDITFKLFQPQDSFRRDNNVLLSFKKNLRQKRYKLVPNHREVHMAMNQITNCFMGSRSEIIVKNLKIVDEELEIPRLPFDLKLNFQELDCHSKHIEYLIPIIAQSKKLILRECFWNDSCFEIPIVQNVPRLTINGFSEQNVWGNTLAKLSNREVVLNVKAFSRNSFIHFLQILLDAGKEIGSYYRIEFEPWFSTEWSIENDLKQRFKAKVNRKMRKSKHSTDPFYFSITIPNNPLSELSVCGRKCNNKQHVEIKVVPTPPKPIPLSWYNVKCVLKYMEENRRICLTTQCPNLYEIELSRPLHLDYLSLGYSSITLNDITYELYTLKGKQYLPYALNEYGRKDISADSVIMPGDIRMDIDSVNPSRKSQVKVDNRENCPVYIGFKKYCSEEITYKQVPNNLEFHVAMKRLICSLLSGKSEIRVKTLEIQARFQEILRLPLGLKLQVQELIARQNVIEFLSPIIDDRSLPLKNLKMVKALWNHSAFQLQIVKDAQNLKIRERGLYVDGVKLPSSWEQTLLQLPNQQIYLKCRFLETTNLINYIQNLMDTGRDVGTIHTIDWALKESYTERLNEIEKKYNRVARITQEDSNEDTSLPVTTFSIALPMSSTSELIISGTANPNYCTIKLEVVPFGQEKPQPTPTDHISKNFFGPFFSSFLSCIRPQNRQ